MENLDPVIQHLKKINRDFHGEITIRIRQGEAVLITEQRTIKLEEQGNTRRNLDPSLHSQARDV